MRVCRVIHRKHKKRKYDACIAGILLQSFVSSDGLSNTRVSPVCSQPSNNLAHLGCEGFEEIIESSGGRKINVDCV